MKEVKIDAEAVASGLAVVNRGWHPGRFPVAWHEGAVYGFLGHVKSKKDLVRVLEELERICPNVKRVRGVGLDLDEYPNNPYPVVNTSKIGVWGELQGGINV